MISRPTVPILSLLLLCLAAMPSAAQTPPATPGAEGGSTAASPAAPATGAAPPATDVPAPAPADAPPAAADPAAPRPDENWAVNCAGEGQAKRCTILQNLVAQQGDVQQRLLTVLVQPDGNGGETLLLALPHGLFLPAGAQIQIDGGEPQKLVIQTSDQNGSYAGIALTPELLAALRKGNELKVSFLSALQQAAAVPVTLIGFSAAYDRMRQEMQAN